MKKLIIFLFISMFIVSFAACSTQAAYVDDESDESPMKIYLLEDGYFGSRSIDEFNKLVSKGEIDGRRIEIIQFKNEQMDEMYDRISTEIMVGEGPDIIIVDPIFNEKLDFVDISGQDAFADMDILIQNSETFNLNDYNKGALDAGIINGTRVLMPLTYSARYMVTTQENLDKMDISEPDNLTYEKFFDMIDTCHNETRFSGANYSFEEFFYDLISTKGPTLAKELELKRSIDLLHDDLKRRRTLGNSGF